jgi:hypothetical protein
MQRAVNTTREKAVFSMWFAYIYCWATDGFFMDPPRQCIRSTLVNQKSVELRMRENENGASPRQSRKKTSTDD